MWDVNFKKHALGSVLHILMLYGYFLQLKESYKGEAFYCRVGVS